MMFSFNQTNRARIARGALLCLLSVFSGCIGGLHIDMAKNLKSFDNRQSMISIAPDYILQRKTEQSATYTATDSEAAFKNNHDFCEILRINARKAGFTLQVVETSTLTPADEDYFKFLAPLKRDMLQSVFLQYFSNANKKSERGFPASRQYIVDRWENCPFIPARYCFLSERYKTPYFSTQGIKFIRKSSNVNMLNLITVPPIAVVDLLDPDLEAYYYNIVVDVVASRVVYKEIRSVEIKANQSDLSSIIYDSFKTLNKR